MIAVGISTAVARAVSEMNRAINEGRVRPQQERNGENTTPTTFEKFAACFAAMYRSQEHITPGGLILYSGHSGVGFVGRD